MIRILSLALLALLPLTGVIADGVDLYTGEVVVASQDAAERRDALPAALEHVLVKLSGLRELPEDPQTAEALQQAGSILVTFYYRNVKTGQPDGDGAEELRLFVRFSRPDVDALARSLELPLWPPDRRPMEVWVVVDFGAGRQVLPPEVAWVQSSIDVAAESRGMPLSWPKPDEEGMYPVDMQLLWGGYTEDLASPRGDGVLILAARREGVMWRVRGNLGFEGENWAWRQRDPDLETALVEGMQRAIDQVATKSAIAANDMGTWSYELKVAGVRNAGDYARCLAHLQGQAVVEQVDVLAAGQDVVTFRLGLTAMPRYLEQSLAGGGVLEFDQQQETWSLAR